MFDIENITLNNEDIVRIECGPHQETRIEAIIRPNNESKNNSKLPKKYIINKNATILFWKNGGKTIVKRSKDDEYNKRLGFLTAFFQKHSGLSKNQANKYLANLEEEGD